MINISIPFISTKNRDDVMAALINGSVSTYGVEVTDFEAALTRNCKIKHAVAVNSGTSALEIVARLLLNDGQVLRQGKVVAVSDYTFIATSNAIHNSGLDVCPVPCLATNYAMSPASLKAEIEARGSKNNRSIAGVFFTLPGGNIVSTLLEIAQICDTHDLPLIIDAASSIAVDFEALLRLCPNFAAIILSFNGNKVITSGAGGAILTNLDDLAEKTRTHISLHRKSNYEHFGVGENKKMPALTAALGLSQLEELDWRATARKRVFETYVKILDDSKLGRKFRFSLDESVLSPSYWIAGFIPIDEGDAEIVVKSRNLLRELNIISPPFWKPLSEQAEYSKFLESPVSGQSDVLPDYLQLPSHCGVDNEMLISKMKKFEEII